MRNYFNSMKKIKFSLFFLLSVFGLCAQSPILVLWLLRFNCRLFTGQVAGYK